MGGTNIVLSGFSDVLKKVNDLDNELERCIQIIAVNITGEAKRLCPVDTGRLRASIHNGKINKSTYFVGTNVHYAPYVEFGTRRMSAKPYLRPAAFKVIREVKAVGLLNYR